MSDSEINTKLGSNHYTKYTANIQRTSNMRLTIGGRSAHYTQITTKPPTLLCSDWLALATMRDIKTTSSSGSFTSQQQAYEDT